MISRKPSIAMEIYSLRLIANAKFSSDICRYLSTMSIFTISICCSSWVKVCLGISAHCTRDNVQLVDRLPRATSSREKSWLSRKSMGWCDKRGKSTDDD